MYFRFRPERPFSVFGLKGRFCQAQAKGLGPWKSEGFVALKGPFTRRSHRLNDPYRVMDFSRRRFPGLRPGLTETAFQAANAFPIAANPHPNSFTQVFGLG
jgi:hypothetical protein